MQKTITHRELLQSRREKVALSPLYSIPQDLFCTHIRNTLGFAPTHLLPGKLMRFATSDKRGDLAGWAILFPDNSGGVFGCWRQGTKGSWQIRQPQTNQERQAFTGHMRKAHEMMQRAKAELRGECARKSEHLWRVGRDNCTRHPYVIEKEIVPYGARQLRDSLLIPIRGDDGELRGLQLIRGDGSKKFLGGTESTGRYERIGAPKDSTVLVCEGWATGCSLHQATGHAVAVAFSDSNLLPACKSLRAKFPEWKIIVCADDDYAVQGNPGVTMATGAARAVGGLLAVPDFTGTRRGEKDTDFNDLAQRKGVDAVARIIREVCHV